jgi:hypothetical protein
MEIDEDFESRNGHLFFIDMLSLNREGIEIIWCSTGKSFPAS